MDTLRLPELARDATLIKGIYESCDLMCMYCPATTHCLLYRWRPQALKNGHARAGSCGDDHTLGSLQTLKHLAEIEGRQPPIEIDAFLSSDPTKRRFLMSLDDPLEKLGGSYMNLANAYLQTLPEFPVSIIPRANGPTPLEVLAWFHDLMPARIFRAVLSGRADAAGLGDRGHDAVVAAKLALIGIERSIPAVLVIIDQDDDPRLPLMLTQLQLLRHRLEARFPTARTYVRPGLDTA